MYGAAATRETLLGFARHSYETLGMKFEPDEEAGLLRILESASSALGREQVQALVQQGRSLTDDAAQALAAEQEADRSR